MRSRATTLTSNASTRTDTRARSCCSGPSSFGWTASIVVSPPHVGQLPHRTGLHRKQRFATPVYRRRRAESSPTLPSSTVPTMPFSYPPCRGTRRSSATFRMLSRPTADSSRRKMCAEDMGVRCAAVPKPGHRSPSWLKRERQRSFRKARAWRAGGEARIVRLKNTFGMRRARYKGDSGVARSAHWAAIANNLMAIGVAL